MLRTIALLLVVFISGLAGAYNSSPSGLAQKKDWNWLQEAARTYGTPDMQSFLQVRCQCGSLELGVWTPATPINSKASCRIAFLEGPPSMTGSVTGTPTTLSLVLNRAFVATETVKKLAALQLLASANAVSSQITTPTDQEISTQSAYAGLEFLHTLFMSNPGMAQLVQTQAALVKADRAKANLQPGAYFSADFPKGDSVMNKFCGGSSLNSSEEDIRRTWGGVAALLEDANQNSLPAQRLKNKLAIAEHFCLKP